MYNQAVVDERLARVICETILEVQSDLVLLALAGSQWVKIAEDMGLRVAREVFADRALNVDGTLVPRSQSGSVIHEASEVAERSLRMVTEGIATAITGEEIPVRAESLCLHGDTPGALDMAKRVRTDLEGAGVQVVPLGQLV
jgi:UPF0271 protein